jgi:predicted aspartyl protease
LGVKTSLYAITALIGLIADAGAADPAPCKLVPIDEWKVRADAPSPIVDGLINGQKIDVLLDTGMTLREGALLERAAARRLGIPITRNLSRTAAGIGGEAALSMAVIDEFRIGGAKRHAWDVIVGGADHGHKGTFIIGNQFFAKVELEFDLPRNVVRLFRSEGCRGRSLAYWAFASGRAAESLPIWVSDAGHVTVEVAINDTSVRAVIDSGAWTSLVESSVAARIGVTPESSGTKPGPCGLGVGKQRLETWVGEFATFEIGGEKISNPKLYFADMRRDLPTVASLFFSVEKYETPEMLLGADFLRSHRVLISRPLGRMFFTYEGGTVFPARAGAGCSKQAVEPEQRQSGGEEGQ